MIFSPPNKIALTISLCPDLGRMNGCWNAFVFDDLFAEMFFLLPGIEFLNVRIRKLCFAVVR